MSIKLSWIYSLALCGTLIACGEDDGGSGTSGTTDKTSCFSDADCSTGYACVRKSSSALSQHPRVGALALDPMCFDLCEAACMGSGQGEAACNAQCTQACDVPDQGTGGGPSGSGGDSMTSGGGPTGTGGDSEEPPAESGVCEAMPGSTGGSTGTGGTPNGTGGEPAGTGGSDTAPDMVWAGTWSVSLDYDARCDVVGNISTKHQSHTLTVVLDGANPALTLTSGNFEMTGLGSNAKLTLNGTLPVRTATDKDANTLSSDTKLSLELDQITSADEATGSISGSYRSTGFSGDCTVENGSITFSR